MLLLVLLVISLKPRRARDVKGYVAKGRHEAQPLSKVRWKHQYPKEVTLSSTEIRAPVVPLKVVSTTGGTGSEKSSPRGDSTSPHMPSKAAKLLGSTSNPGELKVARRLSVSSREEAAAPATTTTGADASPPARTKPLPPSPKDTRRLAVDDVAVATGGTPKAKLLPSPRASNLVLGSSSGDGSLRVVSKRDTSRSPPARRRSGAAVTSEQLDDK